MKRLIMLIVFIGVFSVFLSAAVFASATIDTSNASSGYVTVNSLDISGKTIKAQVEKGSEKYIYTLIKNSVNLPLQMGTGDYKITVLENITGDKYKPLVSELVKASSIDEKQMYLISMPLIEYSVSTKAVPSFKTLTSGKSAGKDIITAVYEEVIHNYTYDFDLAAAITAGKVSGYVPVIDSVYDAKKGICYDYAAIFGGALRSQGIPTRLVMGYVPGISEYHAWNEVLIDGKWISVDTTYDAGYAAAGQQYKMEKDISKTTVIKVH